MILTTNAIMTIASYSCGGGGGNGCGYVAPRQRRKRCRTYLFVEVAVAAAMIAASIVLQLPLVTQASASSVSSPSSTSSCFTHYRINGGQLSWAKKNTLISRKKLLHQGGDFTWGGTRSLSLRTARFAGEENNRKHFRQWNLYHHRASNFNILTMTHSAANKRRISTTELRFMLAVPTAELSCLARVCRDPYSFLSSRRGRRAGHVVLHSSSTERQQISSSFSVESDDRNDIKNNEEWNGNRKEELDYDHHNTHLIGSQEPPRQQQPQKSFKSSTTITSNDMEEFEWQTFTSALDMYKAAYNDLKIPTKFIVPSIPPWPENAWNMKLGQKVAQVRATGKYINSCNNGNIKNEARRQLLNDMGFVWRIRASSSLKRKPRRPNAHNEYDDETMNQITLDQILDALLTYKKNEGDINNIPPSFVVPNCHPWSDKTRGMPLGKKMRTIQSEDYVNSTLGAKEAFMRIGLYFDGLPTTTINESDEDAANNNSSGSDGNGNVAANDARYQRVYRALQQYRSNYGDLLVPQPFVIPSNDKENWPEEDLWGLRLGARVNAIRSQGTFVKSVPDRRGELDELGFVWDSPTAATGGIGQRRGRKKKEFSDATESSDDDWPAVKGFFEGDDTTTNLSDDAEKSSEERVTSGAFPVFDVSAWNTRTPPPDSSGVATFGELPSWATASNAWRDERVARGGPASAFGYLDDDDDNDDNDESYDVEDVLRGLGRSSSSGATERKREPEYETLTERAEQKSLQAGIIDEINPELKHQKTVPRKVTCPWYIDDYGDDFSFEDVFEALTLWGKFHNGAFDIDEDFVIRSPLKDGELGLRRPDDDFEEDFNAMMDAFDGELNNGNTLETKSSVNKVFQDADDRTINAPSTASTVNSEISISWPDHLIGLELGSIVRRIREGDVEVKMSPPLFDQLEQIQFDWGDPEMFLDVPFEKAMCALFAYYQIRGDLFVYEDFVMPSAEPWPRVLAGYPLGKIISHLRARQEILETRFPEKKSMLDMLEFVWFPEAKPRVLTEFEKKCIEVFGSPYMDEDVYRFVYNDVDWDEVDDENLPPFDWEKAQKYVETLENDDEEEEDNEYDEQEEDEEVDEEEVDEFAGVGDEVDAEDVDFDAFDLEGGDEEGDDADENDETANAEATEGNRRDIMASREARTDDDDMYDNEDTQDDDAVVDDEDDLEIEGVDLGMDDDEDDQEGDDLGENEDKFSEDDLLAMSRGEDLFNG